MNPSRTLWIGNIEQWMTEDYLLGIFTSFKVHPIKINILNNQTSKGCCFIEFISTEEAVYVYENCNNLTVNNLLLKIKWVKITKNTLNKKIQKKYSIYVGNSQDLLDFFKIHFESVCSANVIVESVTKESKCFGFVDFTNYNEHQQLLNYHSKIYL